MGAPETSASSYSAAAERLRWRGFFPRERELRDASPATERRCCLRRCRVLTTALFAVSCLAMSCLDFFYFENVSPFPRLDERNYTADYSGCLLKTTQSYLIDLLELVVTLFFVRLLILSAITNILARITFHFVC